MRKIIKLLSTMTLVTALAFVAVATVNVEFSQLSSGHVAQSVAFANDAGGGGDGNLNYFNYYTCTNGATNYPSCNDNVVDYTCTNGATNYPSCNNLCYPEAQQSQTVACSSGQSGSITQVRNSSCSGTTGSPVWSSWITTSNTCIQNTCTNGATNYPSCNTCPTGKVFVNDSCIVEVWIEYCTGANDPNGNNWQVWAYNNAMPKQYKSMGRSCAPATPTADINTNPKTITVGGASTVSWSSTNATYCVLNGGHFNNYQVSTSGSINVSPSQNTTYTIACYNSSGQSATDTDYVNVNPIQQCTNGATNYPYCNNNVCTNGATNYPSCNVCPAGMILVNNVCTTPVNNPTANIYANPNTIVSGNSSTLTWSSTNATYCRLNGGQFNNYVVGTTGSIVVTPGYSTAYTVTCYNAQGASATDTTYINVTNATCTNGATNYPSCNVCPAGMVLINNTCTTQVVNPTANIYANPSVINAGGSTTLTWSSSNATYCRLNGGQFNNYTVGTSGSINVSPNAYTTYSVICYNAQGASATDTTYVSVNQAQNLPTVTIYPSSYSINQGGQVTLNWSSTNASYCTATPWPYSGSKAVSGSEVVTLNQTTTFTITCFNSQGQSAQAQTTVTVNPINYVYCNGVQYPAGTVCPNTNYVGVSTTGANPLQTTANIFGYVNPNGTNATMWFEYGTNPNYLGNRTSVQNAYSAGSYSANLTGLTCGTTYYYRAVAQNQNGIRYGNTLSFVTSACQNYVTGGTTVTRPATAVGNNYGQLNGAYIYGNGTNTNNCSAYFQYGTNYNLVNTTNSQSLYTNYTVNNFSQALYGLAANTTYYYRAVTNCGGQVQYGQVMSFKTSGYTAKPVYVKKPVTVVVTSPTICNCNNVSTSTTGTAANTIYMDLVVERMEAGAVAGGQATYRVTYKNVSETTLTDVAVRVILPSELSIVSADKGSYTVGGSSLTLSVPSLSKLEQGYITIVTKVADNATIGNQISVNAYSNFSVPAIVKNGVIFKDEVTAYVLSVVTNGSTTVGNGSNASSNNSIFGQNFLEWLILLALVLGFIAAIIYIISASRRRHNN